MAVFNPAVPDIQPIDNTNRFSPVAGPGPNKSGQILMETIGNAITDATGIADRAVKQDINEQVYAQVDKEREGYTQALEAVKSQVRGQVVNDPTSNPQKMSFAEEDTEDVPPAVQAIEGQINGLATANKAGKINDTYYTQRLNAIAKSIRTQYPGYREYIDQKISQVTGMDPANAYYKNLMQDINQGLAQKDNVVKQTQTLAADAVKKGYPDADKMWTGVMTGVVPPQQFMAWYNNWSSKKFDHDARANAREENNWSIADNKIKYAQDFTKIADDYVTQKAGTVRILSGDTVDSFINKVSEANAAGRDIDPQTLNQGVAAIQAMKSSTERELRAQAGKVQKNGLSFNSVAPDAVETAIKNSNAYFDTAISQIMNKDSGSFYSMSRHVEGIANFDKKELLTNPTTGGYARALQAVGQTFGPQIGAVLTQQMLGSGLVGAMNTYLKDKQAGMLSNSNANLIDDFKGAKSLAGSTGGGAPAARLFKETIQLPSIIGSTDPRVPDSAKLVAAQYAFNPKNIGLLDELNMDTTVNGKYVPGKYAAYSILTAPQMTNNMWKLRQYGGEGQSAWTNYKNWSEISFAKLFRSDVNELNDIASTGQIPVGVAWDGDNGRFILRNNTGGELKPRSEGGQVEANYIANANRIVNRLNSGLSSLKEVYSKEGGDISSYLAQTLITSGLNPDGKITGLPKQILDNIAASKLRQGLVKPEDNFFQQKR